MSRLRDIKRQARRDLHREAAVPAVYYPAPTATPVPVTVRVWLKQEAKFNGNNAGGKDAERTEVEDRLRFDLSEGAVPRVGGIVSVEVGESYRIAFTYPADLGYQTVRVVPLTAADLARLDPAVPSTSTIPLGTAAADVEYLRIQDMTGHGVYTDSGAAQPMVAGVELTLRNDRTTVDETQKPSDVVTFYDGVHITGRAGDGLGGEIRLNFTPSDDMASVFRFWLDVGGLIGRFYTTDVAIQLGAGVPHAIRVPFLAYNRTTWQNNGASVIVEANGPGVVTGVQYVIHRLHRARS